MRQPQLGQILLVTGFIWFGVALEATARLVPSLDKSKSFGRIQRNWQAAREIPLLSEAKYPLPNAQLLVQSPTSEIVQVTVVEANPTEQGVEVILQTIGEQLSVVNRSSGNSYIADVVNAQLRLPNNESFRQEKPVAGIAEITVSNQGTNTIRVTVKGEAGLPQVDLFDSDEGLIFEFIPMVAATPQQQQPEQAPLENQPEQPSAETNEPIELTVTGRQNGYSAPNATTGTRTDTPIIDIPQSIQVVPQRALEDQQVIQLDEALRNVSNVISGGFDTFTEANYTIRGFDDAPLLIDGFRQYGFPEVPETANLERVEVLKGPASILYGEIQPGGIVNAVTKKPLSEPFYEAEVQLGSYDLVRSRLDISGPLSNGDNLLYRLNASYLNSESFRGFDQNFEQFFVSPVLALKLSEDTDITFDVQYSNRERAFDAGLIAVGDQVIDVPRDRILNEPDDFIERTFVSTGYALEHRFNDSWTLRNAFRYATTKIFSDKLTIPTAFDETTGILDRIYAFDDFYSDDYSLQTNAVGKFNTGSVKHTLLFGVDLNRTDSDTFAKADFFNSVPLDIFNPVYGATPRTSLDTLLIERKSTTNRLGIYSSRQTF